MASSRGAFSNLLGAISFLSVLPVGRRLKLSGESFAKTAGYFPAVGLLIGALGVVVLRSLEQFIQGQPASALIVLFLVVITGGLHIDALADTFDGFFGKNSKEERLTIMSRGDSGPFGVAAVTAAILLKYAAFNSLVGDAKYVGLLVIPALSRWPMVFMAWYLPAVKKSGLGHVFASWIRSEDLLLATWFVSMAIFILSGLFGHVYLLIIPALIFLAVAAVKINRGLIGGVTGDTLGATVEITEIVLFLVFSILLTV